MSENIATRFLDSSREFFVESVTCANRACQSEENVWKVALFLLAVSVELALKSKLSEVHPIFVRRTFENGEVTVNSVEAVERLSDANIGGLSIPDSDKKNLKKISEIRNKIAHATVLEGGDYLAAKYFELFSFALEFSTVFLGADFLEKMDDNQIESVMQSKKFYETMVGRAKSTIKAYDIVRLCIHCEEQYMVVDGDAFHCMLCHSTAPSINCSSCSKVFPQPFPTESDQQFDAAIQTILSRAPTDIARPEKHVMCRECFNQGKLFE